MLQSFQRQSFWSVLITTVVVGVTANFWLTNDRTSNAEAAGNPFADLQQQIAQLRQHQAGQDAVIEELELRVAYLEWVISGGDGGGGGGGGGNLDQDEDGFTPNQGDFNDFDPTTYPGAPEIPDDGIDNDCDGQIDELD